MNEEPSTEAPLRLTPVQWLICIIAVIGFAFDTYELLMLPLVVRPALMQLGQIRPGTPEFRHWISLLFYVPAVAGGIFGLLGGYLTDRFGRRRVLTWSILLYAFSAVAAGYSTTPWMFLLFRTTTFIGVCVEFVAAVAWLAELFPHGRQREAVLGTTQAFSSFGGIMVAGANLWALNTAQSLPAIHGGHDAWRYTLISGVIPAIPLILIRPFLPESPAWQEKKAAGTLKRPSIGELFQPAFRKTTLVTTVMMACSFGAAFGAIQQLPQIVPGLAEVRQAKRKEMVETIPALAQLPPPALPTVLRALEEAARKPKPQQEGAVRAISEIAALPEEQQAEVVRGLPKAAQGARDAQEKIVTSVSSWQEIGGLVGRFILALLAVYIVSRRKLIRLFQVPGLILLPLVFLFSANGDLQMLKWGVFLCGLLTVAQFSFWGNYLPRVYPIHLRGTGESFAANIGGRMIGTSAALLTQQLAFFMPAEKETTQTAYAAALVGFLVYAIGLIASFQLPEPKQEDLPE